MDTKETVLANEIVDKIFSSTSNSNNQNLLIDFDYLCSFNLNLNYNFSSHRKIIGPFIVFAKKTIRFVLRPILNPLIKKQNEYNNAVAEAIKILSNEISNFKSASDKK